MNKEQSADDPQMDLIPRVKNMLSSTISMSYPDVVVYLQAGVSGNIQSN